ncbi:MAG TPA: uracil-DNA glycosylase [Rectinemataceae bacterium]|nr:uracil-DNA glycosylase [Rectinemataceae bacterium]
MSDEAKAGADRGVPSLMSGREALALAADWLSAGDAASGWGGPIGARSASDYGDLTVQPRMVGGEAQAASDLGSGPAATDAARAGTSLDLDRAQVETCRACRLGEGRHHPAYGEGPERPLVLVVGEGPGAEEDAQGRPFVGAAGRLLDRMLSSIGLSRDANCYIANIVKCRPPGNREPSPDEKEACMPWLERQIDVLKPSFILAMGRTAATALLRSEEGIGRLRGRWFERGGIPLIATYHPSALLRDEGLKRPAWEDLKTLKFRLDDALPGEAAAARDRVGDAPRDAVGDDGE